MSMKNKLWKIYFWIFSIVVGFAYLTGFLQYGSNVLGLKVELIDMGVSLPSYIIFYAFIFNKEVFKQPYLRIYTVLFLIWEVVANLAVFPMAFHLSLLTTLPDLILYLPEYIGIVLYSFKAKRIA
jgi:hypothetical protein